MLNIFSSISNKQIALQGDSTQTKYHFELPLSIDKIDMTKLIYKMDLEKSDGSFDICNLEKEVLSDKIVLTWTITNSVTNINGTLKLQIRGFNEDSSIIWHSEVDRVYIKNSINATKSFEDVLPNEFEELETKITLINEEIKQTINGYDENVANKISEYNENASTAVSALNEISSNFLALHNEKTEDYSLMATEKNSEIIALVDNKKTEINALSDDKVLEYNTLASEKVDALNEIVQNISESITENSVSFKTAEFKFSGNASGVISNSQNIYTLKATVAPETSHAYLRLVLDESWQELKANPQKYTLLINGDYKDDFTIILTHYFSWGQPFAYEIVSQNLNLSTNESEIDFSDPRVIEHFDKYNATDINILIVFNGREYATCENSSFTMNVKLIETGSQQNKLQYASFSNSSKYSQESQFSKNLNFFKAEDFSIYFNQNSENTSTSFINNTFNMKSTDTSIVGTAVIMGLKLKVSILKNKLLVFKISDNVDSEIHHINITRCYLSKAISWNPINHTIAIPFCLSQSVEIDAYTLLMQNGNYSDEDTVYLIVGGYESTPPPTGNLKFDVSLLPILVDKTDLGKNFIYANKLENFEPHEYIKKDELDSSPVEYLWKNKKWCSYGDSITAIGNGNSLSNGWQMYVNDYFGFSEHYGRGVGGQKFIWNTDTWYANSDGTYNTRPPTAQPSNTTVHNGSFCSWDRISTMIPKESELVFIMGSTNDSIDNHDIEFLQGNNTDIDWANSEYYSSFGGDYNINTIKGGIASTVMKIQAWCPNAVIILATPLSGRGVAGQNSTELETVELAKVEIIKEMGNLMSIPVCDVYGTCGINSLNRTTYISDGVHPYHEKGKKALSRAVISGIKNTIPNF